MPQFTRTIFNGGGSYRQDPFDASDQGNQQLQQKQSELMLNQLNMLGQNNMQNGWRNNEIASNERMHNADRSDTTAYRTALVQSHAADVAEQRHQFDSGQSLRQSEFDYEHDPLKNPELQSRMDVANLQKTNLGLEKSRLDRQQAFADSFNGKAPPPTIAGLDPRGAMMLQSLIQSGMSASEALPVVMSDSSSRTSAKMDRAQKLLNDPRAESQTEGQRLQQEAESEGAVSPGKHLKIAPEKVFAAGDAAQRLMNLRTGTQHYIDAQGDENTYSGDTGGVERRIEEAVQAAVAQGADEGEARSYLTGDLNKTIPASSGKLSTRLNSAFGGLNPWNTWGSEKRANELRKVLGLP